MYSVLMDVAGVWAWAWDGCIIQQLVLLSIRYASFYVVIGGLIVVGVAGSVVNNLVYSFCLQIIPSTSDVG